MSINISAVPSVKLLTPVAISILVSNFIVSIPHPLLLSIIGIVTMIGAYFIPERYEYSLRWLFSAGSMIALFFITAFQVQSKQEYSNLCIDDKSPYNVGTIQNFGVEKNKTFAFDIKTKFPTNKKLIAYFEKCDRLSSLQPGCTVIFQSNISPFSSFGNPDDFNYTKYMNNKGYAGTTYITNENWKIVDNDFKSIKYETLKLRQKAINFLKNQNLNKDAASLTTALTLGYKEDLSSDIKQSFRVSGTSHVLAVSGLHVGIIYTILAFLVSFMGKHSLLYKFRQILIIILLWFYASMTGLAPSVVRATIMLTITAANTFFNGRTLL